MNPFRLLFKVLKRLKIKMKVYMIKLVYFGNTRLFDLNSIVLGKHSFIDISSKGHLTIGMNFCCQEFVKIKISDGIVNIGDNVFFNSSTSLTSRKKIIIGDNCIIGENVRMYDHNHNYRGDDLIKKQGYSCDDIEIGNNVWIGSNCVVLKGVKIGDNAVIGANTIINKNIPSNHIVYNKKELVFVNKTE